MTRGKFLQRTSRRRCGEMVLEGYGLQFQKLGQVLVSCEMRGTPRSLLRSVMVNSLLQFGSVHSETFRVTRCSGDVAQLVRALPCHGRGRGFEPRRPRQILKHLEVNLAKPIRQKTASSAKTG